MKFHVVGYPLCPFVQRVLITLNHKGLDYELIWLNPHEELPEWFNEWSPLGRVPVVKVPTGEVLFESMAIVEYIEEVSPEISIYPANSVGKALSRAWAGVSGELYGPQYMTMCSKTEAEVNESFTALKSTLAILESEKDEASTYFNGEALTAVDIVLAPMFARFKLVVGRGGENPLANFPKMKALSQTLLSEEAIAQTMGDDWEEKFIENMKGNKGFLFS